MRSLAPPERQTLQIAGDGYIPRCPAVRFFAPFGLLSAPSVPGALVEAFVMVMVEVIPLGGGQRGVVENRNGRVVPVDPRVVHIYNPHLRELRPLTSSETDRRNTAAECGARVTGTPVSRAATVSGAPVGRAAAAVATR